jgi:type I restriction enzyme S subunit
MSFPRYPKYKDSGVEWLGEVPEHWSVKRLKYCARLVTAKADERTNPVALENIEGWTGRLLPSEGDYQGEGTAFAVGDILFGKLRPYLAKVHWASQPGEAVGDFHVLRPHVGFDGYFAQYHMLTREFIGIVDGSTYGSKMPRASWESVGGMPIAVPPLVEQAAIATFLDRETAKIAALIAEQQRLIELLQEKRQAVISHAVTKGLNPDAPTEDSGIEWLGEVPEHWEEFPLGSLMRLKHGYAFDGEGFSDAGEYILMTPGNFHERGGFRSKDPEKYYGGNDFPRDFILEAGQLLVAMTEQAPGLLGSALFVPNEGIYLHNQRVGLVQGLRRDRLCEAFLFYLFNSSRYRAEVSITSTGAKVRHTSPGRMLAVRVWLPPVEEQLVIVAAVDKSLDEIDLLYSASHHSISLLQERRSALISAAVTGQIDVRGLAESEAS